MNANYQQFKNSAVLVQQTFTMPDGLQTKPSETDHMVWHTAGENGLHARADLRSEKRHFVKVAGAEIQPQLLCGAAAANRIDLRSAGTVYLAVYPQRLHTSAAIWPSSRPSR
jgi:hypothetical protein